HPVRRTGAARARRAVVARLARAQGAGDAAGDGARGARARVLARAVAERDLGAPGNPARDGEDAHTLRTAPAGRRPRRRAGMSTPPDFHELVGDEGTPEELAKLRRAHDLLIAAGPPPELSPRLAEPPQTHERERFGWWHARRNQIAFGLAAAVAAAAFGVGYLVGTGPDNFS